MRGGRWFRVEVRVRDALAQSGLVLGHVSLPYNEYTQARDEKVWRCVWLEVKLSRCQARRRQAPMWRAVAVHPNTEIVRSRSRSRSRLTVGPDIVSWGDGEKLDSLNVFVDPE
jgi:hypothetical protein